MWFSLRVASSPCSWGPMSMTRIRQQASSTSRGINLAFDLLRRQSAPLFDVLSNRGLLAALATAQSTSQLNGSVTDPSGASVDGARITLTDAGTGLQRTTTSNASGLYQFLDVPPSTYRVDASATGFAPYLASKVILVVKTPSTLNIKFQVAGMATMVTVEGQAPLINRTDASLGNTIEENQIAQLPIADRNVVSVAQSAARCRLPWQSSGCGYGHPKRRSQWHAQRPIQRHPRRDWRQRSEQWLRVHQRAKYAAGLGRGIQGHDRQLQR